ncbi:MAG: NAD(P)H-quinone oxidoreductase, partial [Calditrichaeota bacterium]
DILVKARATALNRADILQRKGLYPPPPGASSILGLEVAGVVVELGSQCKKWQKGDRVFGLLPGGGYAEYVSLHENLAMRIPDNLDFEQAAAIPEVFLTAYQVLYWLCEVKPGHYVLIHAGASGVGTAAIQLVKEAGAYPIVTAGSEEKLEACRKLGAIAGANYREGPFAPRVLTATRDRGVNCIIDFVGAPYLEQNLTVLATDGRIVLLSLLGGGVAGRFDMRLLMKKRARIEGSTLRNRSLAYKIQLTEAFAEYALPRFADGRLHPVIDRVFSWHEIAAAHQYMEMNKNIGKIVIRIE